MCSLTCTTTRIVCLAGTWPVYWYNLPNKQGFMFTLKWCLTVISALAKILKYHTLSWTPQDWLWNRWIKRCRSLFNSPNRLIFKNNCSLVSLLKHSSYRQHFNTTCMMLNYGSCEDYLHNVIILKTLSIYDHCKIYNKCHVRRVFTITAF